MLAHGGVLPGVHTAELPVLVGLVHHGIQHLVQEIQRGVVQGHHDADLGARQAVVRLPDQQLHRGKAVGPQKVAREEGGILPPGAGVLRTPEMPSRRRSCRKTNSGNVCQIWRLLLTAYRMGQVSFQKVELVTSFRVFSRFLAWLRLRERSLRSRSIRAASSLQVRSARTIRSRRSPAPSHSPRSSSAVAGWTVQYRADCWARPRLRQRKSR